RTSRLLVASTPVSRLATAAAGRLALRGVRGGHGGVEVGQDRHRHGGDVLARRGADHVERLGACARTVGAADEQLFCRGGHGGLLGSVRYWHKASTRSRLKSYESAK